MGEEIPDFPRHERVLPEVPRLPQAHIRLVLVGPAAHDEKLHLLEVGEDREREALVPGVALGLEGVAGVEVFSGLLGFAHEAVGGVRAEEVVGAFLPPTDGGAALDLDFAVLRDEPGGVFHIPAQGAEERVEEFLAQAGLVVGGAFVRAQIPVEGLNQTFQLGLERLERGGDGHGGHVIRRGSAPDKPSR
ncbi:MAG TPA: hypothetical protein PKW83_17720 [Verrucomicrobiota bacterium]|nr:hypothetical protein [Verrucomicrobiota bacterium]